MRVKLILGILLLSSITLTVGACTKVSEDTGNLEDTTWILESYGKSDNMRAVLADTEITIIFEKAERRVRGSSGCNSYGGEYHIDKNKLTISELYFTEMACVEPEGVMDQEVQYLKILPAAESYEVRDGKLRITAGDQLLVFAAG